MSFWRLKLGMSNVQPVWVSNLRVRQTRQWHVRCEGRLLFPH